MLHLIGVLGERPTLHTKIRKALGDRAGLAVEIGAGHALPPSVAAVLGVASDAGPLLEAAHEIGARHDALMTLVAQSVDAREGIAMSNAPHVCTVASHFALAVGLDSQQKCTLIRGALLHDIGKLLVPNDVLLTKAMLTHDEWELLRRHTVLGEELVIGCHGLEDIAPIVRSHHECFDGTGYPDGLEGDAIPLLARMMKLIDVFCAMTGERHYRSGKATPADAIAHIEAESGKHFDPALARVFIDAVTPAEEYPPQSG